MDPKRKQIILSEIEYWRRNKLIPEHYCLFLLNLYREGDAIEEEGTPVHKISFWQALSGILIASGLCLSGVFFTSVSPIVRFSLSLIALISLYILTAWLKKRDSYWHHLSLSVASVLLLFVTCWFMASHVQQTSLLLLICGVLFLWLISGVAFRSYYLSGSGLVGLLLSFGWWIHPWIEMKHSLWLLEAIWLFPPVLLTFVSIALFKKNKEIGWIYLISGLISLIAPEIQAFFITEMNLETINALLLLKLFIAVALIMVFRKMKFSLNFIKFKK